MWAPRVEQRVRRSRRVLARLAVGRKATDERLLFSHLPTSPQPHFTPLVGFSLLRALNRTNTAVIRYSPITQSIESARYPPCPPSTQRSSLTLTPPHSYPPTTRLRTRSPWSSSQTAHVSGSATLMAPPFPSISWRCRSPTCMPRREPSVSELLGPPVTMRTADCRMQSKGKVADYRGSLATSRGGAPRSLSSL